MSKPDITVQITNDFIAAIEGGMLDGTWERPWKLTGCFPTNPTTDKAYRGMNALLLMMIGGGHFAGYGQWQKIGAQVRKGEHGIMILAPSMFKTGNKLASGKDEKRLGGFHPVKIFAAHQVDGYDMPIVESFDTQPIEVAAAITTAMGAEVRTGGDRAFYVPSEDFIQMPPITQFPTAVGYHDTEVHELGHWTGHKSRLDRKLDTTRFGDEAYAFEELIAELASSFVCSEIGIEQGFQPNHAKYLKSWIKALKNDSKAIMTAASKAAIVADVLMGRRDLQGKLPKVKEEDERIAA